MQPACQSSRSTQASSILGEFDSSSEHVKLMDLEHMCLRPRDAGVPKDNKGTRKIAGTCLVMTRIRFLMLADAHHPFTHILKYPHLMSGTAVSVERCADNIQTDKTRTYTVSSRYCGFEGGGTLDCPILDIASTSNVAKADLTASAGA